MNYKEQLKSPKWQKKRLEVLSLRGFKCENCANEEKQLHVHHRFYLKGRKAWEYDNDVLQVLCETCHENEHKPKKENNMQSEIIQFIDSLDEDKYYEFFKIVKYLKSFPNEVSSIEKIINNQCDFWCDSYVSFDILLYIISEFYDNGYEDFIEDFIEFFRRGEIMDLICLIRSNQKVQDLNYKIHELNKLLNTKNSNKNFLTIEDLAKKVEEKKEEFNLF
jgi:hypothetical protein